MFLQTLRRVSLAVLFTVLALSTLIFMVNQRVVAEPSAPNVPLSYPGAAPCNTTLQACIDGSTPGDVINIAAGSYITSVTLNKPVSLIGAGTGSTFIRALSGQRVMTVTGAMTDSTQIANLTVQNGDAGADYGGGIYLAPSAQPLIQNVNLVANSASYGGGLFASSPITLVNVSINNNFATNGNGGGMYAVGNTSATNSVFQNNTVITNGYGGGLFAGAGFVGNNVNFIGNTVNNGYDGGGLYASGRLTLNGGQFVNNQTTRYKGYGGGGGLMAFGSNSISISSTQFSGNTTADWGGGAYIANSAAGAESFITNVLFLSNTALNGGGGGLFMWFTSTLSVVDFFSNSASYHGGGAYAGYAGNYATLVNGGQYLSNTASGGGGLYSDGSFTLIGTQFLSNTSRSNGNGGGAWTPNSADVSGAYFAYNTVITGGNSGGLDTGNSLTATDTIFVNNRTLNGSGGGSGAGNNVTLNNVQYISNSAPGYGGGLLAYGTTSATGSLFMSNTSSNLGGGLATTLAYLADTRFENNRTLASNGGGIFAQNGGRLTNTLVLSNTAFGYGGGMQAGQTFLTGGIFQGNRSSLNGGGLSIYDTIDVSGTQFIDNSTNGSTEGGGAMAVSLAVTVKNSHFRLNTAANSNGGAIWTNDALNLHNTTLTGNTATLGDGGAAWSRGATTIDRADFINNQSGGRGGALFISSTVTVSASRFINNFATSGGGLYQAAGNGRIVNSLFARNAASSNTGMALYLAPTGTLQISFTTIAAPALMTGDAVRITSGNVDIQDTIVTSHTYGLYRAGGAVAEGYNLFFGAAPIFGATSNTGPDVTGNPAFLNSNADNYHLGLSSAAIDAGTDVGIYTDIDGQTRPQGAGFDIGFDEAFATHVYLPLILR